MIDICFIGALFICRFKIFVEGSSHLPKAPYVLTILKESNDVFMACRDDSRFCTTGMLRYAIKAASMSSNTRRTQRPAEVNGRLHHQSPLKQLIKTLN